MQKAAPHKRRDDDERRRQRDNLEHGDGAPAQTRDDDFHAHMGAAALAIGEPQKSRRRHRLLDPIDESGQRQIEKFAPEDLRRGEQNQPENDDPGGEIERVLDSLPSSPRAAALSRTARGLAGVAQGRLRRS